MQSIYLRLLSVTTLALAAASAGNAQTKLPVTQLSAGIYVIQAEVAATDAERQQGLMMRTKMGPSEGMVFDFGAPAGVCMWMKNTLIPLSVAFIDNEGKIINIEDMQPETLDSHCAKKVVRYALEMNQAWFKQKNIKPGSKINGLPLH
ncbi:DUF192 domain-containing protein [Undibacterium sp.]|uniref:DUF192 domain-containing protein n=1 Tax=Undibacterium sp. TaxID=1914977 RepID=UPI00351D3FE6